MIKTLLFNGPRSISYSEREEETLKAGQVRVKTLFSGISHGTEMAAYRGTAPFLSKKIDRETGLFVKSDVPASSYPTTSGYENVGEVIELGENVKKLKLGDKVFSHHCHETGYISDEGALIKLEEDLSPELGIFIALARVAHNGILDARINLGETVAVFGLGVVGQLVAQMAKASGAETVIGIDLYENRLNMAKKLGADAVLNPKTEDIGIAVMKLTSNRGADVAIECSGAYTALHEAIRTVGYNGIVVSLSYYQGAGKSLYLGEEFHHRRVQIKCSQNGGTDPALPHWTNNRRTEAVMKLLYRLRLKELITHVYNFEDAAKAYEMVDKHPSEALLVVLKQ